MFLIPSLKNSLENTWYWGRGGEKRRKGGRSVEENEVRNKMGWRQEVKRSEIKYKGLIHHTQNKQTFDLQSWTSSFTGLSLMVAWRAKKKQEKRLEKGAFWGFCAFDLSSICTRLSKVVFSIQSCSPVTHDLLWLWLHGHRWRRLTKLPSERKNPVRNRSSPVNLRADKEH